MMPKIRKRRKNEISVGPVGRLSPMLVRWCRECRKNTLWDSAGCRMSGSHVDWDRVTKALVPELLWDARRD